MVYFKLTNNSNNFVNVLKKLKYISTNIIFHFVDNGLKIFDINKSNNLFYYLEIKKDYFEEFSLKNINTPEFIDISILGLFKILKLLVGTFILEILIEDTTNILKLIYQNKNKKNIYIINVKYLDEINYQPKMNFINIKNILPIFLKTIKLSNEYIDTIKYRFQEFKDLLIKINFNSKILKIQSFIEDFEIAFTGPIQIMESNKFNDINEISFNTSYQTFIDSLEFTKIFSEMSLNIYSNNTLKMNYNSNNIILEIIIR